MRINFNFGRGLRPLPRLLAVGAVALPLAACDIDELLNAPDPARVTPEQVDNPQSVQFLVSGALREFFVGYSGAGGDSFLSSSSNLTDELYHGDTFTTRQAVDQREMQAPLAGNTSDPAYVSLQRARVAARRAAATVARVFPDSAASFARMRAIEAMAYVTLAEGWCGNLPFGNVPETGPLDPTTLSTGPGISTAAALDSAIVRFNEALARNPNDNLAKLGKARALQGLGGDANIALAAATVASVPDNYVFFIEHSSNSATQQNPIANLQNFGRYGVSNLEGADSSGVAIPPHNYFLRVHNPPTTTTAPRDSATARVTAPNAEGLNYRGAMDPRVYWAYSGGSFTASIPKHLDLRYAQFPDDVPVASGIEARLIQAEAALRTGNVAGYLGFMNGIRTNALARIEILYPSTKANVSDARRAMFASSLPPLTDPGATATSPAAARDARLRLLFRERAFWMFNTGHRQGDLRRMIRDYGYTHTQVFPSGPYYRVPGTFYGDDVAFPLPQREENNQEYVPSACIVEQA
ncbi:MAG TPA: hypothetical protein VGB92_06010 [Longimicrobium sp.]